jgi:hypothetical protein
MTQSRSIDDFLNDYRPNQAEVSDFISYLDGGVDNTMDLEVEAKILSDITVSCCIALISAGKDAPDAQIRPDVCINTAEDHSGETDSKRTGEGRPKKRLIRTPREMRRELRRFQIREAQRRYRDKKAISSLDGSASLTRLASYFSRENSKPVA